MPSLSIQSSSQPEPSFRAYRAPSADGSALIEPKLAQASKLWHDNRSLDWTRRGWWPELRRSGRRQLVRDAIHYTSAYRSTSWAEAIASDGPDGEVSVLMAGHQPELFHAGVWFKNFALDRLACTLPVIPVNLIVDNDVAMRRGIRVPSVNGDTGLARYELVSFDRGTAGIPYEQLVIGDREQFNQFDRHVKHTLGSLVQDPCVVPLWSHARQAIGRCGVAGCALAQARHSLEADVGLRTLEIPLSVAVRSIAFAKFLLAILCELPRFQDCYNGSASVYRHAHGIRSTAHPVPNLAQKEGWLEAPLWIYGDESPQRRAAWIRLGDNSLVISDRQGRECVVEDPRSDAAAAKLAAAQCHQWKIRPRALITTMYSRLVLSDLFLHGIGGGKYDQLGDQIIRAFFEIAPPSFMVMSATIRLPGSKPDTGFVQQESEIRRRLRDTVFQPETFADQASIDSSLIGHKRDLLNEIPSRGQKRDWHLELNRLNQRMSDALDDVRHGLLAELQANRLHQASQAVLNSREHSFCLFPLEYLTQAYEQILSRASR